MTIFLVAGLFALGVALSLAVVLLFYVGLTIADELREEKDRARKLKDE